MHGGRDHCRNWDWVAEHLARDWHIIAPDLRGHGDSEWSKDGTYMMAGYIYDLAQLVHQLRVAPVTIVGHSLGGNIALRYAGLYPENVAKLIAIEGLGASPKMLAQRLAKPFSERMRAWIDAQRGLSGRLPRRYATIEDAFKRMQEENKHLTPEQARHLTQHGVNQNEDGTYSWKFDNYVRSWPPYDMTEADIEALWARIACPTLLVYGRESWASNPADGWPRAALQGRRDRHRRRRRPLGAPRPPRRLPRPDSKVSAEVGGGPGRRRSPISRSPRKRRALRVGRATQASAPMAAPAIAMPATTSTK